MSTARLSSTETFPHSVPPALFCVFACRRAGECCNVLTLRAPYVVLPARTVTPMCGHLCAAKRQIHPGACEPVREGRHGTVGGSSPQHQSSDEQDRSGPHSHGP